MEKIFKGTKYTIVNELGKNINLKEMQYDSRKIKPNDIFIALEGFIVDGHNYIEQAIKNGAKLIIASKTTEVKLNNIGYVLVENLRQNLGKIASNYYEWPQKELNLIGVTGTNGKTTSTYILEHLVGEAARLGTIEYKIGDEIIEAQNTTPESLDIVKMCKKTLEKGIKYLIMEVSSHALELGRVSMLEFKTAIFTNLSQDHLDFHKTMDNYFRAKSKLFEMIEQGKKGIVNIDNEYGKKLHESDKARYLSYSIDSKSDIIGKVLEYSNHNMEIKITYGNQDYIFSTELMGKFNLYNILGAFGAGIALGYSAKDLIERLKTVKKVPGRFETVNESQNFMAVVDYAHTDDGLLNILSSLSEIKKKRIITVFGAGGDRDISKRPKMAKAAAKYSDYIIITSDNPRTESPDKIIKDIMQGIAEASYPEKQYKIVKDRDLAIKEGVMLAKEGDILLVAGKGHETYQVLGKEKIHFDDREVIKKYIASKK